MKRYHLMNIKNALSSLSQHVTDDDVKNSLKQVIESIDERLTALGAEKTEYSLSRQLFREDALELTHDELQQIHKGWVREFKEKGYDGHLLAAVKELGVKTQHHLNKHYSLEREYDGKPLVVTLEGYLRVTWGGATVCSIDGDKTTLAAGAWVNALEDLRAEVVAYRYAKAEQEEEAKAAALRDAMTFGDPPPPLPY